MKCLKNYKEEENKSVGERRAIIQLNYKRNFLDQFNFINESQLLVGYQ